MDDIRYEKGEYVVYGNNGICLVEDITSMKFGKNKEEQYYVLRPQSINSSTVFVPMSNEKLLSKMRYIMSKAQIDSLLDMQKGKEIEWISDKNERSNSFKDILASGDRGRLLLMISCIYLKKQELSLAGKKLNISDERVLKEAQKLVEEEFSYSLNLSGEDLGVYIRKHLGITE